MVVTPLLDHLQRSSSPLEGFWSAFQSSQHLLKVSHDPLRASDNGPVPIVVLLDLDAGFAVDDQSILIQRVEQLAGIKVLVNVPPHIVV